MLNLGFYIYKNTRSITSQYVDQQIRDLSYIKTKLVALRINTVELTKLDPNRLDFLEEKNAILSQIETTNQELTAKLEEYNRQKAQVKKMSLTGFLQHKIDKKFQTPELVQNAEQISSATTILIMEYQNVGQVTQAIYNIYLPSDYQKYNIDFSSYYQGELKDKNIFTDVRSQVEQVDRSKFNTKDLILRLDQVQALFDECLAQTGKEIIAYEDIGVCEDALSIDELKDLAYQTELSYLAGNGVLETLTDLTNTAYNLEAAVNGMRTKYQTGQ